MPASPNPLETMIGAGFCKWKGPGDTDYRDLGETDVFSVTMTVERKQYKSKRTSARKVVRTAITDRAQEIMVTMKELSPENLAMWALGTLTPPVGPATYSTIAMMSALDMRGQIRFIGTTDVGEKVQVDATVDFAPNGAVDFLVDDWAGLEMTGQVIDDPDTWGPDFSFGRMLVGITEEVTA